MESKDLLVYWMGERERVRTLKERGDPKPWSEDDIFQRVYFCNVRREDDRVTKHIRAALTPYVDSPDFEWLTCMARIFNWPPTIDVIMSRGMHGEHFTLSSLKPSLEWCQANHDKIWGGAYVITTHGQRMTKLAYCVNILRDAYYLPHLGKARRCPTLAGACKQIMNLEGFSTFLAGQVVADLKNTPEHPLWDAPDWHSFCTVGPGSMKGLRYFFGEDPNKGMGDTEFQRRIVEAWDYVKPRLRPDLWNLHMQDFQNCLCEYSKYRRVQAGGRTKRNYPGLC